MASRSRIRRVATEPIRTTARPQVRAQTLVSRIISPQEACREVSRLKNISHTKLKYGADYWRYKFICERRENELEKLNEIAKMIVKQEDATKINEKWDSFLNDNMDSIVDTGDVMSLLFNVFRMSIDESNRDKEYFLGKLKEMSDIGEALADYLKKLNEIIEENNNQCTKKTAEYLIPVVSAIIKTSERKLAPIRARTIRRTRARLGSGTEIGKRSKP